MRAGVSFTLAAFCFTSTEEDEQEMEVRRAKKNFFFEYIRRSLSRATTLWSFLCFYYVDSKRERWVMSLECKRERKKEMVMLAKRKVVGGGIENGQHHHNHDFVPYSESTSNYLSLHH